MAGVMSAGGDCVHTLSDQTRSLTLDEWIEFLEPKIEPPRGAAICMSSESFTRLKIFIEQSCEKLGRWCSKEIKAETAKAAKRVDVLQSGAMEKKRKKKLAKGGV